MTATSLCNMMDWSLVDRNAEANSLLVTLGRIFQFQSHMVKLPMQVLGQRPQSESQC